MKLFCSFFSKYLFCNSLCVKATIKILFMDYVYAFTEISLNSFNSLKHNSKLTRLYSCKVLR